MNRFSLGLLMAGFILPAVPRTSSGQDVVWPRVADGGRQDVVWPRLADGGAMFVLGERVEPPYLFTLEEDTLRVNGTPVKPVRRSGCREPAVSPETRERHGLLEECFELCDALFERGVCRAAVRDSALGFLRGHPRVGAVRRHEADTIRLEWKGRTNREEYVMIPFETPPPPISWTDMCGNTAERYAGYLAAGSVVLVSAGGEMVLHAERRRALEDEIEILRRLQDPEAEEIEILSAEFAREFLQAHP